MNQTEKVIKLVLDGSASEEPPFLCFQGKSCLGLASFAILDNVSLIKNHSIRYEHCEKDLCLFVCLFWVSPTLTTGPAAMEIAGLHWQMLMSREQRVAAQEEERRKMQAQRH